jgi:hypothetical protein
VTAVFRISIFIVVVAISSCRDTKGHLTDSEKETVTREVQGTLSDYYSDIREKGLRAEFAYLDTSAAFFWVPPGSGIPLSYDSIYKVLNQNAPMFKSIVNEWDTLRVTPLSLELALYTGRLRSTATDTSGMVSTVRLVETGLMIKRMDGWKLLSGQTSLVPQ